MLDIVCTCYEVREFILQAEMFASFKHPFNFHYITNFENESVVEEVARESGLSIQWLPINPGKHLGAFYLAASASPILSSKYTLHMHADMVFGDVEKLPQMFADFQKSKAKVGGIPRHWNFDEMGVFQDNKSLPFRSEYFFIETDLYTKVFDINQYAILSHRSIANGHPSLHFEPIIYAGLELNGVDFQKDVYYLENIQQMKQMYGNNFMYYNTTFPKTLISRLK